MKNILTIAGSDPCGGAGIQRDIRVISSLGCCPLSVITTITVQNTVKMYEKYDLPEEIVKTQIEKLFEDIKIAGVKIGALGNSRIIYVVSEVLKKYKPEFVVLDPIIAPTHGDKFLLTTDIEVMKKNLFPLIDLITPNIKEAEILSEEVIKNSNDITRAGKFFIESGIKNVIIKGGHLETEARDTLFEGKNIYSITSEKIEGIEIHGTGCAYSSALTCFYAKGYSLKEAFEETKKHIDNLIKNSISIGKGKKI